MINFWSVIKTNFRILGVPSGPVLGDALHFSSRDAGLSNDEGQGQQEAKFCSIF